MKLILDVESVHGNLTGIGRYTHELAVRMPEELGAAVKYWNGFSFQNDPTRSEPDTESSIRLDVILRRLLLNRFSSIAVKFIPHRLKAPIKRRLGFLFNSVNSEKLEDHTDYIFHGPNFFLPNHSGKKVVTIHDLSVFRFPEHHPEKRVKFMSIEVPKALECADAVIAISEFTKHELLEYFPFVECKVHVVPNGANKPASLEFTNNDTATLEKLSLEKGSFFFCVSTIEPRKNLSILVDAYLKLPEDTRERNPLVLVGGNGWKSDKLMEQIHSARESNVRYLGYVDQDVLQSLYKSARAFVFPSLYEGFGLPAIEAMAYGLPVVCASSTAVSEVCSGDALEFSGDSSGQLSDILQSLAVNEELRAHLSAASYKRAAEYSWDRCCKETVSVYRSLMGNNL